MAARQYQVRIHKLLAEIFGRDRVRSEWNIRTAATDRFRDPSTYAPRVDIAVGPFNLTSDSIERDVHNIHQSSKHKLIQEIISTSHSQNDQFEEHRNPRCLLAIEI